MTTNTLGGWDAARPPAAQPRTPVAAFYIGGDDAHTWTDKEISTIRARWGLPIWVCVDASRNGAADAHQVADWLDAHNWTRGVLAGLDTETVIIPGYVADFNETLHQRGYDTLHYRSKDEAGSYAPTYGGAWTPDWTGRAHLYPGDTCTQWASGTMLGADYDADLWDADAALHELNPPAVHHIVYVNVSMRLPVLGLGDRGAAVGRMQALITAWNPGALAPDGVDGMFGTVTEAALADFQRAHGDLAAPGICSGRTWQLLTEG